jgi:hypothetical protein
MIVRTVKQTLLKCKPLRGWVFGKITIAPDTSHKKMIESNPQITFLYKKIYDIFTYFLQHKKVC